MISIRTLVAGAAFGLLAFTSLSSVLARDVMNQSVGVAATLASFETNREVPLGLLIKRPETPHGASFNQQIAVSTLAPKIPQAA